MRNTKPARNGIHRSDSAKLHWSLCWVKSSNCWPTVLATPPARMKLAQSPAARASVIWRPSSEPRTSPKTIPRGKPFRNMQGACHDVGTTAKRRSEARAAAIRPRIIQARRPRSASETTRIPMIFEIKYPMTWAETNTAF